MPKTGAQEMRGQESQQKVDTRVRILRKARFGRLRGEATYLIATLDEVLSFLVRPLLPRPLLW
jgi:hypothetical protein